jgi:hypothetical protein
MKSLLLQRICSSVASGLATAQKLLAKEPLADGDDDQLDLGSREELAQVTPAEKAALLEVVEALSEKPEDPKLNAVWHYLSQRGWLELGCIV